MHIVNLLERLLLELIPFIVKDLSNQDLKNFHSINNTWAKEIDLEWFKRRSLFDFWVGLLIQDKSTVKEYYSKLKDCNKSVGYSKEQLKWIFLNGLSPENAFKVCLDGLKELVLDEIVERLSPEQ